MIDWRKFAYSLNMQLIHKVERQSTTDVESVPRCIIEVFFQGKQTKLRSWQMSITRF